MQQAQNAPSQLDDYGSALTIDEICQVLNVSRPVVYRIVRDDPDFPVFRAGRRLRIRKEALKTWIRKQEQKERVA